jgi:Acetyl-coenzyme A transporter 1
MLFLSVGVFATAAIIALFISEKKISIGNSNNITSSPNNNFYGQSSEIGLMSVLKSIPLYLKNKYVRSYLIYIMITKTFESMISEPTKLKMMEFGVDKSTLVNVSGIVIPLEILLSFYTKKYLIRGEMIKFYHYFLSMLAVSIVFKYLINKYIEGLHLVNKDGSKNPLPPLALILIILECVFYSITKLKYIFLMGFRNLITDEELGSTSMTLVTSTWFLF